ncbi:MAG: hypothetical protein U1F09_05865 [Steroidobacteraceae bacterium]
MGVRGNVMVRACVLVLLAAGIAGCGHGDEGAVSPKPTTTTSKPLKTAPPDKRLANAVSVGKSGAAVDLQYDLLAKPVAGQPFEIELSFTPRKPADSLEVEAHGMTGLELVTGGTAAFQNVTSGQVYTAKLLVLPAADGMYYVGVTAKLTTKVQSEARAFSVPVVVGVIAAPAAPAAAAAGAQPVQAPKAQETAGTGQPQ